MPSPTPAPLEASNLGALAVIRHGFFTREGGVSRGIYESLNCGIGSYDEPALVLENRSRVARHLGGHLPGMGDSVITLYQEHGTTALAVTGPVDRAKLPHADAVVSATPGLVIGVLTADCAPVLLADAEAKVVAAAHAGWRGAVGGIVESAIAEMERLGAKRERIAAAVGPCINQAAYEVGDDFEAQFVQLDPSNRRFFKRVNGAPRPFFDLPGFVVSRLSAAGLGSVAARSPCTFENESLFFSYRRKTALQEPDYGRQISAIVVA